MFLLIHADAVSMYEIISGKYKITHFAKIKIVETTKLEFLAVLYRTLKRV